MVVPPKRTSLHKVTFMDILCLFVLPYLSISFFAKSAAFSKAKDSLEAMSLASLALTFVHHVKVNINM